MKRNDNIDVQKIICEINNFLNNDTEMIYVKSLGSNDNYKEKEIQHAIRKIKINKIIYFFKKLFKL